jgi:hypothetical protein
MTLNKISISLSRDPHWPAAIPPEIPLRLEGWLGQAAQNSFVNLPREGLK